MYKIPVKVRNISPIIIPVTLGEANVVQTREHIPGSVLLGMFAAEYIRRIKAEDKHKKYFHEDDRFFNWFLGGSLTYIPAYPCDQEGNGPYFPAPLYLHCAKKEENDLYNIMIEPRDDTRPLGGYTMIEDGSIIKMAPKKKLRFHHRRDSRISARSEEGGIFNYESLEPEQLFQGYIVGKKDNLEEFLEFYNTGADKDTDSFTGRVGRSKNTQYGQVQVELQDIRPFEPLELEIEDLSTKDSKLKNFYLTLCSPLIIYNECGFSETTLDNLVSYLERDLATTIKINNALSKTEAIESYVSVWKAKRPLEQAFCAGSCFEIEVPQGVDLNKLEELLQSGLGERSHEGFGRFKVVTTFPEEYRREVLEIKKPDQPKGPVPETVSSMAEWVIRKQLFYYIETRAIKDANNYAYSNANQLPTNSLLGRLELMAKEASDNRQFSSRFAQSIGELKKAARDQLVRCWKEGINLYEQLEQPQKQVKLMVDLLKTYRYKVDINEICGKVGLKLHDDPVLINQLLKTYWLTLFRRMRKINQENEKKAGGEKR